MLTFVRGIFFFVLASFLRLIRFDGLLGCPVLDLDYIRSGAKEVSLGVLGAKPRKSDRMAGIGLPGWTTSRPAERRSSNCQNPM